MAAEHASLRVNRSELATALKTLAKRLRRKQYVEVVLSFEAGLLRLQTDGISVMAGAEGEWAGQARVHHHFLVALAEDLPNGDPLALRIENDRFYVGKASINCVWHASGAPRPTQVPVRPTEDPTLRYFLTLSRRYTDAELREGGLLAKVVEARNEQAERVRRAAELLEPLGVDPAALKRLVATSVGLELSGEPVEDADRAFLPLPSGWKRPQQLTQRNLFTSPREAVLAKAGVTLKGAVRWYERGWLSFDPRQHQEINFPERLEILFLGAIIAAGFPEAAVSSLLASLPSPHSFDPQRLALSPVYGWIELPEQKSDSE